MSSALGTRGQEIKRTGAAELEINGELVAWDTAAGRLDFAGLQARMTAGRRLATVAARRPAQFVAFDVLAEGGHDLRNRPLRERRKVLERALFGMTSPIALSQQTTDVSVAREWFETLTAGVGLVRGGAGTALIDSHEQGRLTHQRLPRRRHRGVLVSGCSHLQEAYAFAEGVRVLLP